MRIILQRVLEASVSVGGKEISRIGRGLLVLLGITDKDDNKLAEKMAKKLLRIRVWDEIMSRSKKAVASHFKDSLLVNLIGHGLAEYVKEGPVTLEKFSN